MIMMMIVVLRSLSSAFKIDFFILKARSAFMIDSNYGRRGPLNHRQDGTNANKIKENYNDKIIYASFAFYCNE